MADANQSRRTFAPRAAEPCTQMVAFAEINNSAQNHFNLVDRLETRLHSSQGRRLTKSIWSHQDDTLLATLKIVPTNDVDALILAGTASMMSEQLESLVGEDDPAAALVENLREALGSITAWMATNSPDTCASIEATWPELARCISIDIRTADARAADQVQS